MLPRLSKRRLLRKLIRSSRGPRGRRDQPCIATDPRSWTRSFQPRVRRLEPRFVLNATAELNALGQLLVLGTSSSETIQMEVDGAGDLLLRDEVGTIIPINNHPDGVGFETNPLDPSAVTSGQVVFAAGGSRDFLDLQLPSGLNVTVIDGDGDDLTKLRFVDGQTPGTVTVESDSILIEPNSTQANTNGTNLILGGSVTFGQPGQSNELSLGDGRLYVIGRLILSGDTTVSGQGASVDLSDATLTTIAGQTDLTIDLQNQPGADFTLGGTDGSAGGLIQHIDVRSASTVSFVGEPTVVEGSVTIQNANRISIDVDIDTTAGSQDGSVTLTSTEATTITSAATVFVGDATITMDGGGGAIDIGDGTLQSDNPDTAITIRNASDLVLGDVIANSGQLTLGIGQNIFGDISQATGTVVLIDRLAVSTTGSLDLSNQGNRIRSIDQIVIDGDLAINNSADDLSVVDIDSRGRNVAISSPDAVRIGSIDAPLADVRISSASINDAADDLDVDIVGARVFLDAQTGIGNIAPLELMSVAELTAMSQSGAIVLDHLGDQPIELRSVTARDGAVMIGSVGSIEALEVVSQNSSGRVDGSRDIHLITSGAQSDIIVTSIIANHGSDIFLTAGDDIIDSDLGDSHVIVANSLRLLANNETADSDIGINLSTAIDDIEASVVGVNRGDLFINETDSILLTSPDAINKPIVHTSNGQVVIAADGDITIVDLSVDDDGPDWKLDPEIVAGGDQGRIDLDAAGRIEFGNDVQIHANKVTTEFPVPVSITNPVESGLQRSDRAVFLKSDSIEFGERIEINTGADQGVARFFAPVPIVVIDRTDPDIPKPAVPEDPSARPAFFDPFTVNTNILEQAIVNDATGILSIDIGRDGERGLTVDIDWGADSNVRLAVGQFQQINGLSADTEVDIEFTPGVGSNAPIVSPDPNGFLKVEHFYTQDAIVDSRENGRLEATDPLEVRFAVRHHDSILIQANEVSQAPDLDVIPIPGNVVSTTDNPTTPANSPNGLENGQASFIIPSLSIPVAFFPVRDVIPELETPQFLVSSESVPPLAHSSLETVETTVATTVLREEYFQIRVLSADPSGEDLVKPQRLPDDILNGDKIQQLFQRLPDGSYEIDYVLGDGNERSILRVDVRGGQAALPDEPLDSEGILELDTAPEDADQQPDSDQPAEDNAAMDGFGFESSAAATGVTLVATIKRRNRKRNRRFSASSRFVARRNQLTEAAEQQAKFGNSGV